MKMKAKKTHFSGEIESREIESKKTSGGWEISKVEGENVAKWFGGSSHQEEVVIEVEGRRPSSQCWAAAAAAAAADQRRLCWWTLLLQQLMAMTQ